jgi:membrane-associated phospholipid phosphatase
MFQTDFVVWLQSLGSPILTWLLSTVTLLGYAPVYIALMLTLAFGMRLRPSLAVLLALLVAGISTDALKTGLALPRPSDIDARVQEPGDATPPIPVVQRGGGASFWTLPTAEAIAAVRAQPEPSYGFPSGHVALATAFFLAVALFFRSRHALVFGAFWAPLMAVSRMYLGRHFLADVLGGVVVGVLCVLVVVALLRRLERGELPQPPAVAFAPIAVVSLLLLVLTPFVSFLDADNVGRFVGVVVAYGVVFTMGFPSDRGSIWQRGGRVLTAVALYVAASRLLDVVFDATGWEDSRVAELLAGVLLTAMILTGTVAVCRRLRLYVAA